MATIEFYKNDNLVLFETTELNVNNGYIEYNLFKMYENDDCKLWATLEENGVKSEFVFTHGKPLEQFIYWKQNVCSDSHIVKRSKVLGENKTHFRVVFDLVTGQTSDICKTLILQK